MIMIMVDSTYQIQGRHQNKTLGKFGETPGQDWEKGEFGLIVFVVAENLDL